MDTVSVIATATDIERIREPWERFQWHPNADIDFFLTICSVREEILHPYILVVERNGEIISIVAGRIEKNTLPLVHMGYKELIRKRFRCLTLVYGGLMGDASQQIIDLVLDHIAQNFRDFDLINFSFLPVHSQLYGELAKERRLLNKEFGARVNPHWEMTIPSDMDGFFSDMKRKHRYQFKQSDKLLGSTHAITFFTRDDELDRMCTDIETISKKTYQHALNSGVTNDTEYRKRLSLWLSKRSLVAPVLYIDGVPCAFWIGVRYHNTFFLESGAYDPAYRGSSPGTYLFIKLVQYLAENTEVNKMDFGFGDAFYKQRFGNTSWGEQHIHVFAPGIIGLSYNLLRSSSNVLFVAVQRLLIRLDVENRVKKIWRRKLSTP